MTPTLGPHISYRRYDSRTILIDHRTRTTYELNDAAGEILDHLERGNDPLPEEREFVTELETLALFDHAPRPFTEIVTGGTEELPPDDGILITLKRYGEQHCIPVAATFSVTYRCILACHHCFLDRKPATADGELTLREIESIFDQLRDAGTLYLTLTGGEPFMREDILDIVAAARKRRFAVSLLTSGYLCGNRDIDTLAALWPENVQVSLYGSNGETHDRLTGVTGSFDRAMRTIHGLRSRGIAVTTAVAINTLTAPRAHELARLLKAEKIPVSYNVIMLPARSGTTDPAALNLSEEELATLIADLAIPPAGRLAGKGPDDPPCAAARSVVAIDPYGTVFPCYELNLPAGSLRESSFSELWLAAPFEDIRRLRFRDCDDCPYCTYRALCGRCPALAIRMGGKITDHAILDCRVARAFSAAQESIRGRCTRGRRQQMQ